MIGIPDEQKKTMRTMLVVSPVMILFVTMSAPAGLGLYFFVGGLFACLQTLIINYFRPRIRREVEEELKKNPIKMPKATAAKPVNATEQPVKGEMSTNRNSHPNEGRNAGKQQRHHH